MVPQEASASLFRLSIREEESIRGDTSDRQSTSRHPQNLWGAFHDIRQPSCMLVCGHSGTQFESRHFTGPDVVLSRKLRLLQLQSKYVAMLRPWNDPALCK